MQKNKLLRVTQVNAIFLDNELHKSLLHIIQDITRFLPPGLTAPIEPEMNLFLRLLLLYNSVYKYGSTFGQQLLSIKYQNISPTKKVLYLIGNCLDYVKTRAELLHPSHPINNKIFKAHTILMILNFINISIFLRNGAKPKLIERVLGLEQVYTSENNPRVFDSKYLARELLWNGYIDVLIHILPMINYHKIRRTVRHLNPLHKRPTSYTTLNTRTITMHSKCAHCGENPILPHHMGCAHIFCYVCLKGNQTADSRYECPSCEHRNPNLLCDRVSAI